jgi:hypothetical protein
MYLLDLVALYITPQQTSVAFGYIRLAACLGLGAQPAKTTLFARGAQPAETQLLSEKGP